MNFKDEVLKRQKEIVKTLQDLVRINSELTTFDPLRKNAPFGYGNQEALDYMLNLGKKDGFKTVNLDYYAGHIEYGDSDEYVGIIGHLDVVPAGNGWTYPPYEAQIHNGVMYGRGTEDDKGPTIAAYFALKILKELNVPLSKRVKLILGCDEESGWRCVTHYFNKYPQSPVSGFIPDADFPLIYGEKGIFRANLKGEFNQEVILNVEGGFRDNMVPDYAKAVLKLTSSQKELITSIIKDNQLDATLKEDAQNYILTTNGKSAHGSTPEEGINAVFILVDILTKAGIENELTSLINRYLIHDTKGDKLGIYHFDQEMGGVTSNLGVIHTNDNQFEIVLNIRYPHGTSFDFIVNQIKQTLPNSISVHTHHHQKLLYHDPQKPMIQTLLKAYQKYSGDYDNKIKTIGGGTFARATENVVAFGLHMPGKPSYIHQKDEYIEIDDLLLATTIYLEALYQLAK